jgi:hypothetical protein
VEVNSTHTNPTDEDSDGDGLTDGAEVNTHGTDPLAADSDGDGLSDGDEVADGSDPLLDDAPPNSPPFQPTLVVPNQNEFDITTTPVLVTDEFADPDKTDSHAWTQWQISTDAGFSYLVFELISDRFLTTLPLHDSLLSLNTRYYWRVKFIDSRNAASEWAEPFSFTTMVQSVLDRNLNGIPDSQEVSGITDLDENKVADGEQSDMLCLNTIVSDLPIGMKWSNNVTAVETLSSSDGTEISETLNRPSRLPYGVISFKVFIDTPGETVEVTFMSADPFPENLRWFKYDLSNGWHDYSQYVQLSVNSKKIVLTLTDGGPGDADGVENGVIVDPSALTTTSGSSGDSASYLQGSGEPAASKASCFISVAGQADGGSFVAKELGQRISMGLGIGCLLTFGIMARWGRCIRKGLMK